MLLEMVSLCYNSCLSKGLILRGWVAFAPTESLDKRPDATRLTRVRVMRPNALVGEDATFQRLMNGTG